MSLKKLKLAASKIGAKIEDDKIGKTHECCVFSPQGKMFSCDSIHILVDSVFIPWKPDYKELQRRMEVGLEDCTDAECEWCYPEED